MSIRTRAAQTGRSDRIRLFFCGDVMTGRGIDQILAHPGDVRLYEEWASSAKDYVRLAEQRNGPIPRTADAGYVWGAALDEWRKACPDLRIANLETSVTRCDTPLPKGINYRMNPENVGCLLAAGLDCCVLANNHVLDWGRAGLLETLQSLHGQGVRTAGAGRDDVEAREPAVFDLADGGRVLVVALATPSSGAPHDWAATRRRPGVNITDLSPSAAMGIGATLDRIRRPGDNVVASIHWGPNWGYGIPDEQRRFAHDLIDAAGVDVVHGHSSHHPKAIEVYKERLILYGCGDFMNDYEGIGGYEAFRADLALMYFADLRRSDGTLASLEMIPLKIRRFQLCAASDDDGRWLQGALDREAGRFGGAVTWRAGRLVLSWPRVGEPAQLGEPHELQR
jgi:poly-gamma-glutamate synthesis protein (capsule biosynthesis protein)